MEGVEWAKVKHTHSRDTSINPSLTISSNKGNAN
jgi:hypothetical protein